MIQLGFMMEMIIILSKKSKFKLKLKQIFQKRNLKKCMKKFKKGALFIKCLKKVESKSQANIFKRSIEKKNMFQSNFIKHKKEKIKILIVKKKKLINSLKFKKIN